MIAHAFQIFFTNSVILHLLRFAVIGAVNFDD